MGQPWLTHLPRFSMTVHTSDAGAMRRCCTSHATKATCRYRAYASHAVLPYVAVGAAPPVVLEVLHPSAARPAEGGEPVDELRLEWQAVSF